MDKFDPLSETIVASSPCIYNKQSGLISVSKSQLAWRSTSSMTVSKFSLSYAELKGIHVNASTSDKCLLKVSLKGEHETAHLFQFTGDAAQADREKIKSTLAEQLQKYRTIAVASISSSTTSNPSNSLATSSSSMPPYYASLASPTVKTLNLTPKDIKIRGALLSKNKELLTLHKELVLGGTMNEQEFWDTRQPLLALEAAQEGQLKGMSSAMTSELRPSAGMGGEIKYTLTPSIIHSIFIQHPTLRTAYQELVGPDKMSEKEFWTFYFSSKLFNKESSNDAKNPLNPYIVINSTSMTTTESTVVSEETTEPIHPLLNVVASVEDHPTMLLFPDTEDAKAMSLMRKLNRHSELVLKTNLTRIESAQMPTVEAKKKISIDELIGIEDLDATSYQESLPTSQLELKDQTFYLTSLSGSCQTSQSTRLQSSHNASMVLPLDELKLKQLLQNAIPSATSISNLALCHFQTIEAYERFNAMIHKKSFDGPAVQSSEISPETLHFYHRTNEILRHFWSSTTGLKDPELKMKNQRMLHLLEACWMRYAKMSLPESQILESLKEPLSRALEKGKSLHLHSSLARQASNQR